MIHVDFYTLAEQRIDAALPIVGRLIERHYQQQHRIYVLANNQQQAFVIDEMLWTFKPESFIPHHLAGEGPKSAPPVTIGYDNHVPEHNDTLFNLNNTIPAFFNRFRYIVEFVVNDKVVLQEGRKRYRFYQQHGCKIQHHDLRKASVYDQ